MRFICRKPYGKNKNKTKNFATTFITKNYLFFLKKEIKKLPKTAIKKQYYMCTVCKTKAKTTEKQQMCKEKKTQSFNATNNLGCKSCPLGHNCGSYMLACELIKNKYPLGARLICLLQNAENACAKVAATLPNSVRTAEEQCKKKLFKYFVPAIYNAWHAHNIYENANVNSYENQAIVCKLGDVLEQFAFLDEFDIQYCENIKGRRAAYLASFKWQMSHPENQGYPKN